MQSSDRRQAWWLEEAECWIALARSPAGLSSGLQADCGDQQRCKLPTYPPARPHPHPPQGKDVFEAFYKKDLAKRLLLGRSSSIDAEKACISKLKAECGAQFTTKLEGMFKDVELSHDVVAGFRASLAGPGAGQLAVGGAAVQEMGVHVLTLGFWPSYPADECSLPEVLTASQQVCAHVGVCWWGQGVLGGGRCRGMRWKVVRGGLALDTTPPHPPATPSSSPDIQGLLPEKALGAATRLVQLAGHLRLAGQLPRRVQGALRVALPGDRAHAV